MKTIPIIQAYDQSLSFIAAGRSTSIRLRYNYTTSRWSLDLSLDDEPVLTGQRMPLNTDALSAYDFGIGALVMFAENDALKPDYENLISGAVQLVHVEPEELT